MLYTVSLEGLDILLVWGIATIVMGLLIDYRSNKNKNNIQ